MINPETYQERNCEQALAAHAMADELQAQGVDCYVRRWHLGQHGWWVVDGRTYARLNVPTDLAAIADVAFGNRQALDCFEQAGCYGCLEVFKPSEIRSWTDDGQTALCPRCGIDSVVPGLTDLKRLEAACAVWLSPVP